MGTDKQFNSYLRKLKRDIEEIQKAVKEDNKEKATELLDILLEDTQKDIED